MITRELLEELGFTAIFIQYNDNLARLIDITWIHIDKGRFFLGGFFSKKKIPSRYIAEYQGPDPELVLAQLKLALNS